MRPGISRRRRAFFSSPNPLHFPKQSLLVVFPLFALLPLLILHLHYFITVPNRSESSKCYALGEDSSEPDPGRTKHSNSRGDTVGSLLVRSSSIKSTVLRTQRFMLPLSAVRRDYTDMPFCAWLFMVFSAVGALYHGFLLVTSPLHFVALCTHAMPINTIISL